MTPTQFKSRIRKSIANESLQIALDNNTQRRLKARATAFESLPDWRERRQRAHAIHADVIDHLDEYLDKFIAKVGQNGIVVHRAANAAEATKIVLEISKNSPQNHGEHGENQKEIGVNPHSSASHILIAKSKSMVSEEIELNHALEAAGHRVVETDLGEYIVQLRGEKPAHIITPAVHLRRHEVGKTFSRETWHSLYRRYSHAHQHGSQSFTRSFSRGGCWHHRRQLRRGGNRNAVHRHE